MGNHVKAGGTVGEGGAAGGAMTATEAAPSTLCMLMDAHQSTLRELAATQERHARTYGDLLIERARVGRLQRRIADCGAMLAALAGEMEATGATGAAARIRAIVAGTLEARDEGGEPGRHRAVDGAW
jgi:hypothetical protein